MIKAVLSFLVKFMNKSCQNCATQFEITDEDLKFYDKISSVIDGKKYPVPPPTFCPDCRQQRRIAFRNDQNYYSNSCTICKKNLISIYSPDKKIPVLCSDCFWSDRFDPLLYGQDFDFNRPFFEQFAEMRAKVPRLAIFNTQSENSEYTVHSSKNRNCYMGSSLVGCEDVFYSDWAFYSKDSMDLLYCNKMEFCYGCVDSQECFNSDYLELCTGLSDSFLNFDCKGSQLLIGCVSLRNQKNQILNKPATKEECLNLISKLKTDPKVFKDFKQEFEELKISIPKKAIWTTNVENCSGNYIVNSKNARNSYNIKNVEDANFSYESYDLKDCHDVCRVGSGEMLYECKGIVDLKYGKFCNLTYQSDNMQYCDNSQNSHNCFGCMSLKQHRYCILNKQYSQQEYEKLLPKIIEQMKQTNEFGEFFPITISPFGYNETKAQEFYPLTKEHALKKGFKWSDYEQPLSDLKSTKAQDLESGINKIPDEITNWIISSEKSGKPFKIIPQELKFYRKKGLPVPHLTPKERHYNRVAMQNPRKLYARNCDKCQKDIQTTYATNRPEKVFCEECYLKIIY